MNDTNLSKCKGFRWDEGILEKNRLEHKVSKTEREQVFFNHPLVVPHDSEHSDKDETSFCLLGQTDWGRFLFIIFSIRDEAIRVISARDMSTREKRTYIRNAES
jgi:uncharacterized DUF497 family protein